jgi:TolB-like protein/Tfp pilus assembly protein PilF
MSADSDSDFEMEIAYVLFIDVVGFTQLLINQQGEVLNELNRIIRQTGAFQSAESAGKLVRLPSGDGMALAFFTQPEAPVKCALEICEALTKHPRLLLRMGIHSGPVSAVTDVNDRPVVAGTGINMAQRVMDCGDAGHILLSKRIADDLGEYSRWAPHLYDLGEVEVKHGVKMSLVNLYTGTLGNPEVPEKLQLVLAAQGSKIPLSRAQALSRARKPALIVAAFLLLALLGASYYAFSHRTQFADPEPIAPASLISRSPTQVGNKSIAVLPFENLSRDPDNEFFTDGVQDEIRTDLARVADLKVISRTSAMQYKTTAARNLPEIAQALRVTHILEGSVQRATNRVRVAVQLIDARADAQLWAERYDRPLDDVFAIQSEIAKAIVEQLRARISPTEKAAIERPPTTNLAAFDLYNRAKALIATSAFGTRFRGDLSQAERLLNDAVSRDPTFMAAYCELAGVHDYIYFYGIEHTPVRLALAQAAVTSALKLRPESGEAHLTRAQHLYRGYFDYNGARAELAIARRTLPHDPRVLELMGYIDRRQGRQEEGLRNLERALELDPRNFGTLQQIALSYGAFRRYSEMAAILDRALAIVPADVSVDTRVSRAQVNLDWQADTEPLHAVIEAIVAENPAAMEESADNWLYLALCERDPVAASRALAAIGSGTFGPDAILFTREFGEGLVARMQGDSDAAESAFAAARVRQEAAVRSQGGEYAPGLCVLGLIDAGLGRKEDALREGRRAVELLPLEQDALNGLRVRQFLAVIYGWVGENDLACQQLAATLALPASASYGELRLHPYWDSLRGDPCFEKIVDGLAPKNAEK